MKQPLTAASTDNAIGPRLHFKSEEDAIEWDANHAPEPDALFISACCGAALRCEDRPITVCPETGYRDGGEVVVCAACGGEAEVEPLAAMAQPKPLASSTEAMRETQACLLTQAGLTPAELSAYLKFTEAA